MLNIFSELKKVTIFKSYQTLFVLVCEKFLKNQQRILVYILKDIKIKGTLKFNGQIFKDPKEIKKIINGINSEIIGHINRLFKNIDGGIFGKSHEILG